MNGTEIFGIKRYDFYPDDSNCDSDKFFTILPDHSDKNILFCGVKTGTADIENIPKYLSEIKKIADEYNAYIICINEENVTGYKHIESAVFHAKRSWFDEKPISNSFEMEVLLYAGGTRQCSLGSAFGLKKGRNTLYICICITQEKNEKLLDEKINEIFKTIENIFDKLKTFFSFFRNFEKNRDEKLKIQKIDDEKIKRLMKIFDISEKEIESVGKDRFDELVLERVALLDVSK